MSAPPQDPAIPRIEVRCAVCGGSAATVELVSVGTSHPRAGSTAVADLGIYGGFGDRASLVLDGVVGKSAWAIEADQFGALQDSFARGDWRALYAMDPEWLPAYCPACDAHYCGAHWNKFDEFDDGFYDCTRGTCPRGHRRILAD